MKVECWQNSWLDVLYLDILIDADLTWSELLRPLHHGCSFLC